MQKDITLKIDIEVNDDKHLIHTVHNNTYNAVGYIDVKVSLGSTQLDLPIKILWNILKSQNMQDEFREITTRCISGLKEALKAKSEGKVLSKKDYFSEVTFSYYETGGHFCVVVGSEKGLETMEEYWNKFLDKEWRK